MLEKSCSDETRKKNKVGIRGFLRLNTGNLRGENNNENPQQQQSLLMIFIFSLCYAFSVPSFP